MNRLSSHFENKADEAQVARMWGALDQRLERSVRWRPFRRGVVAMATCVAIAALAVWARELSGTRRGGAQVIELADGSRVEHEGGDQLQIATVTPERVEVHLRRGRAHFRVARNPKRAFVTRAGAYSVRVIGTEYSVDLGANLVRVEVSRGEVEVSRANSADLWRVRAGEIWSSARVVSAPVTPAVQPAVQTTPSAQEEATPPEPVVKASAPKPGAGSHSALELFQRAQEARIAGRRAETGRLLDEFMRLFPDDPRAGLAAFELGKLRLEAGDARGAIAALDHAESAGAALSEQVDARRVQALEQLGELERCRAARTAFLSRYPGGTFAEVVRRRCP